MAATTTPRLALRGITKQFGDHKVLKGVDLTVAPGEFIAIVGRSGCGKSTLLRIISQLDAPTSGTVEIDGQVWSIADFQHVKPGKGAAFVRTRLKNVMTGAVLERTFSPTDKYPRAHIETKEMQYLYNDGELYYFMDTETYEQLPLNHDQVEDAINFIVENMNVNIRFYKGNAFSVEAPNFVELTVTETEPGFKGDTATGTTKPATLETGYKINVPLFVNEGDRIRVDTRTGEYMERV